MSSSRPPILVCYDGSEAGARVVAAAGALFPGRAAIVLYIWPGIAAERVRTTAVTAVREELIDEVRVAARREATAVAEQGAGLARRGGLNARPVAVDADDTAQAIVSVATKESAAAVVLGRPRRGRLGSLLPTSLAHSVLDHCEAPVVLV
jgi:nucleotide-binding universal stress UspA family protein